MKAIYLLLFAFATSLTTHSQVGIGTSNPSSSAKLDVSATDKGFLPPRISLTATNSSTPINGQLTDGLLIYNTAISNDVTPGYYYWASSMWKRLMSPVEISAENLTGTTLNTTIVNSSLTSVGTISSGIWNGSTINVNKGGTGSTSLPANQLLVGNGTNGILSIAPGASGNVLTSNGTSWSSSSPSSTFSSDITVNGLRVGRGPGNSSSNTVLGIGAFFSNTTGINNVAIGQSASAGITTGGDNVAIGVGAGGLVSTGTKNTFIGTLADGTSNITNSTAIGNAAYVNTNNTIRLGNSQVTSIISNGKLTTGSITYPNTDGTTGQVLTTDGMGTLNWQNVSTSGTVQIGGGAYVADWINSRLHFMRIGNMVFFTAIIGKFTMNANQQAEIQFKPPISSNFANSWDAMGTITTFNSSSNTAVSGSVTANPVYDNVAQAYNLKMNFTILNATATNIFITVSGSYIIR